MARNAGFAFAASFTEASVNLLIRAYHAAVLPPFPFSLPDVVTVAGVPIGFSGSLVLVAPRVTLRTNPDDLVTVWLAFAGPVTISGGVLPGPYQLLLATTLQVGMTVAVTPDGDQQDITAGLDLTQASVTDLDISVYAGPPLDQSYNAALTSPDVLGALTTALRQIPPALVQLTPSGFGLPLTKTVAYQPPQYPPVPNPRTLFTILLGIARVVVRPLDSATGGTGALVIGIDIKEPATTGDPTALVDLNTLVAPVGYALVPVADGLQRQSVQDPTLPHNSQFAFAVNGSVIIGMVNDYVAREISNAFVSSNVAFSPPMLNGAGQAPSYDTLAVQFGTFTPPLSPLTLSGIILTMHLVYYNEVQRYPDGYPVETDDIDADLTVTACITLDLHESALNINLPLPPPVDANTANVSFSSDPPGSYFYLDGGLVELGLGPTASGTLPLEIGVHELVAPISGFNAWTTALPNAFDNPYGTKPPAVFTLSLPIGKLEVLGDGAVQLQTASWTPLLTANQWSFTVQSLDVALPVWADIALILGGPVLTVVTMITSVINRLGWSVGTLLAGYEDPVLPMLQNGINDQATDVPLLGQSVAVIQLPGTAAPDLVLTGSDVVISDQGVECYANLLLSTPNRTQFYAGSVPYLLITDQPVTDPGTVTVSSPGDGTFPMRVDGNFTYPLAPGPGIAPPPVLPWDVHQPAPIVAVLKLPDGLFNPQDPTLQASWTLISTDSGAVLQTTTAALYGAAGAAAPWIFTIDHASDALQAESGFRLTLTLFQSIGGGGTLTVFATEIDVAIADHYDRHHPFVQWGPRQRVFSPGIPYWNAKAAPPGTVKTRYVREIGASRIHRTDVGPGNRRCVVSDTSGRGFHLANNLRNSGLPPDTGDVARPLNYPWTYLDALPLTAAEIAADRNAARGVLCDYCFFGGPDKTQLRADFPMPIP